MIAGDQTEQRGFTGAVRADDLPMFAGVNLPVEMIEDRPIVIADHAVAQDDQRPIRRQRHLLRRILGLRQRQPAEVLAVRQLRHQRVRHHGGAARLVRVQSASTPTCRTKSGISSNRLSTSTVVWPRAESLLSNAASCARE